MAMLKITALGDSAVVVSLGSGIDESALPRVRALAEAIERVRAPAILDVVPAFATVAVYYDPVAFAGFTGKPLENVIRFIQSCAQGEGPAAPFARATADAAVGGLKAAIPCLDIPVCYGGEFGPDLGALAAHSGLSADEVVARHCGAGYRVHAIGFMPGFPYLAGLPRELHMPRRDTPRTRVPAGSVGIGGAQTGVYPAETPGGWQLIGRSPLVLFSPDRTPPALLRTGDRVRFRAISRDEFERLEGVRSNIVPPAIGGTMFNLTPSATPVACLKVLKPGLLTTLQDLGRTGHRSAGVPLSGAMDAAALRAANRLVGNPDGAAGLEVTLLGPELEFVGDATVAVCGAEFEGVPAGTAISLRAGERIAFGRCAKGCRAYLAVSGGFAVPPVLGSRSTYLRGGFGGFCGRALKAGDILERYEGAGIKGAAPLPVASAANTDQGSLEGVRLNIVPPVAEGTMFNLTPSVRAVRGEHFGEFGGGLFEAEFKVTPQSDRMGIRLSGARVEGRAARDMVSGAVVPGTVQVPPDGQPIILMADAQTIGGYPQAAHVATADLPILAQMKPGEGVRFREISLEEAQALMLPGK